MFAVVEWNKIIRSGFQTSSAAYEWKMIYAPNAIVVRVK